MITVKAIKQSNQANQPKREDYATEEREKRRWVPIAFLLFMTGCVAYLKSFLPVSLEAHEERDQTGRPDAESGDPQKDADFGVADDDTAPETTARDNRSSGDVVRVRIAAPRDGEFLPSDSTPIDFKGLQHPRLVRLDSGAIGDPVRGANDNRPAGPANPSSGTGGGGGGGGDDNPRDPRNGSNPEPIRNRAPRIGGPVQLQNVVGCQTFMISVLALLAGTTDPDGDQLQVVGLSSSSGTVTPSDQGGWLFVRDDGMLGDVTLTYLISDGSVAVQQVAYFSVVEAPPIVGTVADDNLLGTHCSDTIDGGAGNDNIDAREGNDVVVGGSGNDHIVAGSGNDIVYAGLGNDIVFAGAGNDIIFGGAGNDRLFGEDGDDTIFGEDGDDLLVGGPGADILLAGLGKDNLQGDTGNDTLDGGEDDDSLAGGDDDDVLVAGTGDDTLDGGKGKDVLSDGAGSDDARGGDGDDRMLAAADAADDSYDGEGGHDVLDYSVATLSITVDLKHGSAHGLEIGRDLIAGFEEIISGRGDDHLIAGSGPITMTGGEGNDAFEFQRATDDHQPDIVRKITDFTVGDRIIAASYEIYYLNEDGAAPDISDLFDDIYLSGQNDQRQVRFRFEQDDARDITVVDVHDRPDNDQDFFSIQLSGHHHLQFTVAVS
jgi:Ca2+-binding RTX toxin-like protein